MIRPGRKTWSVLFGAGLGGALWLLSPVLMGRHPADQGLPLVVCLIVGAAIVIGFVKSVRTFLALGGLALGQLATAAFNGQLGALGNAIGGPRNALIGAATLAVLTLVLGPVIAWGGERLRRKF